jgi:uncharacterized protein YyaL (SSP411 family)
MTYFQQPGAPEALYHTYKNGEAKYPAFLDDYAYLIQSCIALYEITTEEEYLITAKKYCRYVIENFSDPENIFFYFTHQNQQDIIVRKKEIYDGAMPSANAVMAKNLLILSVTNETSEWRLRAEQMLLHIKSMAIKYPTSFGNWAMLLLQQTVGINEIKIEDADPLAIINIINNKYVPNKTLFFKQTKNKKDDEKLPKIYLCKNGTCLAPFTDIQGLLPIIEKQDFLN